MRRRGLWVERQGLLVVGAGCRHAGGCFFGPAEVGKPNTLHITAIGRNGLPVKVVDMTAELANPEKDVPPIQLPIKHAAKGHYIGEGIRVPAGRWVLTITAYPTQIDAVTATSDVTVG